MADAKSLWHRLVMFMLLPTDPSNLAVFRILFGLLMVLDIPQERGMAGIMYKFEADQCNFPLIHGLQPLPIDWMHVVYLVMFLAAWGILLGFFYRTSCTAFVVTYWYVFILDKSTWNNHSYLYGLFGIMLLFCDANRSWSLDGLFNPQIRNAHVPMANYLLLRFQVFLVYFYAGLKKLDMDWMTGYSMTGLSSKWVFAPFRLFLSEKTVNLVLVHHCGLAFDLFEGFLLVFSRTRPLGILLGVMFHTMNSQMFHIGMFSYTMLATMLLFCAFDWPKRVLSHVPTWVVAPSLDKPQPSDHCVYPAEEEKKSNQKTSKQSVKKPSHATLQHKASLFVMFVYIATQLFLPYSHFLTPGYNAWTQGLYGYSWDMMVHSWSTQHLRVKIVDQSDGKVTYIRPGAFLGGDRRPSRWSSHPDMIKQYTTCLIDKLKAHPEIQISEPAVYLDIWRSMNQRFQQRFVDPTVDLATAPWSPFNPSPWVKPLLTELSPWREKFRDIHKELREKSNFSEVVFVADFPNLHLENFVSEHLNASLTVMHGRVHVEIDNVNHTLDVGGEITVPTNDMHRVYIVSDTPACYMYIYMNITEWNNQTIRNWVLHPETAPVSRKRSKLKNVTNIEMLQHFMMAKYYTFHTSFSNTFYALRHLILGIEPAMTDDVPDELSHDSNGAEDDSGSDDISGSGTSHQDGSGRNARDASSSAHGQEPGNREEQGAFQRAEL